MDYRRNYRARIICNTRPASQLRVVASASQLRVVASDRKVRQARPNSMLGAKLSQLRNNVVASACVDDVRLYHHFRPRPSAMRYPIARPEHALAVPSRDRVGFAPVASGCFRARVSVALHGPAAVQLDGDDLVVEAAARFWP